MLNKLNQLVKWHENKTLQWMELLRLEAYHMYCIAFIKGVITVLLLQWLI